MPTSNRRYCEFLPALAPPGLATDSTSFLEELLQGQATAADKIIGATEIFMGQ
jgi:hypothetical protein